MKVLMMVAALAMGGTPTRAEAPAPTAQMQQMVEARKREAEMKKREAAAKRKAEKYKRGKEQVASFIRKMNKSVPEARVMKLATYITVHAVNRGIEPMVVAAILAQESAFRPGLYVCHPNKGFPGGKACDAGLGQVNWQTWGKRLNLDRERLIHDDGYNISVALTILTDLKKRFGREPTWWTRYHDYREERRGEYLTLVARRWPPLAMALRL